MPPFNEAILTSAIQQGPVRLGKLVEPCYSKSSTEKALALGLLRLLENGSAIKLTVSRRRNAEEIVLDGPPQEAIR